VAAAVAAVTPLADTKGLTDGAVRAAARSYAAIHSAQFKELMAQARASHERAKAARKTVAASSDSVIAAAVAPAVTGLEETPGDEAADAAAAAAVHSNAESAAVVSGNAESAAVVSGNAESVAAVVRNNDETADAAAVVQSNKESAAVAHSNDESAPVTHSNDATADAAVVHCNDVAHSHGGFAAVVLPVDDDFFPPSSQQASAAARGSPRKRPYPYFDSGHWMCVVLCLVCCDVVS
jgi:hypothetical protein